MKVTVEHLKHIINKNIKFYNKNGYVPVYIFDNKDIRYTARLFVSQYGFYYQVGKSNRSLPLTEEMVSKIKMITERTDK